MTTTLIPILASLAAALVVLLVTPWMIRLANGVGAVAKPSGRSMHSTPTPLLGGVAILVGFLVPVLWFLPSAGPTRGLVLGAVVIALLGVVDDKFELAPIIKLAGQIVAAIIPVAAGLSIDHVTLPGFGAIDLGWVQYPVTIIWFTALVNIINFIDGMDGLAAGVSAIGATTFAVLAASLGRVDPAILAASLAGACAAFLVFNFHPARIFMGDSGSMFLGFVLAGVAINGVMKSAAAVAVFGPLLILLVPILDTSFVVLKRLKHGRPVYGADKSHFHHRFATIGWSQRRTVLAMYAWCALMSVTAIAIRFILPYADRRGHSSLAGTIGIIAVALLAAAGALYLVYVLEILKWRKVPVVEIVRTRREQAERERV
jgi:UDP-GlcNAc:undecaprenyl-phosphate/decaprenyl-phosphate GlcNAc-1-phosphate transferase